MPCWSVYVCGVDVSIKNKRLRSFATEYRRVNATVDRSVTNILRCELLCL